MLWQVIVWRGVYSKGQLPAPLDVWAALRQMEANDELAIHFQASGERVFKGFAIGTGIALALGLLIGLSRLAGLRAGGAIVARHAGAGAGARPLHGLDAAARADHRHDPQDADDKRRPFAEATDGAVGLETLLAAALRLHHSGELPLLTILRALTINPAKLLGLHSGKLTKGAIADIILFDPGEPWVVNKDELRSRSKNTPFDESKMQGRVLRTLVAGETVYQYPGAERS